MDGTADGAADVRSIVVTAKELYENQQFSYAGPCGDNGFLELYTTEVRGVPTRVVVVVSFNDAGQTQEIVVNHRPRSALLSFSRVMLEKFAGTPWLSIGKAHHGPPLPACRRLPVANGPMPIRVPYNLPHAWAFRMLAHGLAWVIYSAAELCGMNV